jgi:hypothetical protein
VNAGPSLADADGRSQHAETLAWTLGVGRGPRRRETSRGRAMGDIARAAPNTVIGGYLISGPAAAIVADSSAPYPNYDDRGVKAA